MFSQFEKDVNKLGGGWEQNGEGDTDVYLLPTLNTYNEKEASN